MTSSSGNSGEEMTSLSRQNDGKALPNFCVRLRADSSQSNWRRQVCGGAAACSSSSSRRRHNNDDDDDMQVDTFALQDPGTDRMIDIHSSFGPTGLAVLLWKMVATMWIFSVIVVGVKFNARHGHPTKYFYYLSNWATVVALIYSICSLASSAFAARLLGQQPENQHRPNLWVRFTWIMFVVAAHLGIVIGLAYWANHFHSPSHKLYYRDVTTHGGVGVVVLLDGLVVNRIPVRLGHFWQFTIWIYAFFFIFMQDHSHAGNNIDDYTVNNPYSYKTAALKIDLSGKLTRFQDQSPEILYTAIFLHGIAGILIVIYGLVIKRIPIRFAYSWQAVLWIMVLIAMFSLADHKTASCIEIVAGRLLPYVFAFLIFGPPPYLFLFVLSLLSCFGCSGRNRRYLPVVVPNGRELQDVDDDCVDHENEESVVMIRLV
jgi:hypothetical protein